VALHNYHDAKGKFPAAASADAQGKVLLSWRVHLLPYLGQEALYKEFHLDEPWDSEHNKKLIAKMPAVYRCPNQKKGDADTTTHPGLMARRIADVTDGTANTIFIVEANDEHAVIWTKPEDLKFDPDKPRAGLEGHYSGGFLTLFVDGSTRFVPKKVNDDTV